MKSNMLLSSLVIGLVSIATGASATTIVSHGADFVAYDLQQSQNLDYFFTGVRTNISSQNVIAPVNRNPITSGSQTFTITGRHFGVFTSSCSVNSYLADGTFLAQKSLDAVNVNGAWSRSASMTAAELPSGARVSVLCNIAGPFNASIAGVLATP